MIGQSIRNPFPVFFDTNGETLEDGYIYVGISGLNPEVSPIDIFWDKDFLYPAAQPVRTINGLPARGGTPSAIFTKYEDYSIKVTDKNGKLIFSAITFSDIANEFLNPVDTIAALKLVDVGFVADNQFIEVKGYYAAGDDGGGAFYWDASSTDADNSGTIIQSTGVATGRWIRPYLGSIHPKWFGAKGDDGTTDDTVAIQAAIDSLESTGGSILFGSLNYKYSNLTTSASSIKPIAFLGNKATLTKSGNSGTGLLIQGQSGSKRKSCLIDGINFTVAVSQVSGEVIKVLYADHTVITNVQVESGYGSILVEDSFDTKISTHVYCRNSISYDIKVHGTEVTQTCIDTYISNVTGEGVSGNTTKTGLILGSGSSGVYASDCDFVHGQHGIRVLETNAAGPIPEFAFFSQVLSDTTVNHGWMFDDDCKGFFLTNCWAATTFGTASGFNFSAQIFASMANCTAIGNNGHGVRIASTGNLSINGGIFSGNSLASANVYDGIRVEPNITAFSIQNVRSGNLATLGGGTQAYGISIQTGSSDDYSILGNDVGGNGTGGIQDDGGGKDKRLHNNIGFNPRGYTSAIGVPASTVSLQNEYGYDCTVYVVGGTVSVIEIGVDDSGYVTTGVTSGAIRVPAGGWIKLTYSAAPTWTWFGD